MSLREYYSESLGETYVVDHIRLTDKPLKKRSSIDPEGETGKRVYRKEDKARLKKGEDYETR